MTIPTFTLNNGVQIPQLGYGVFRTDPGETAELVGHALRDGYRHIDTAASYGNEREVGEAIRASGLDRSEVFIETKVWINDFGYDETLHAFDKAAGKLGVEQIDLLILHMPLPTNFDRTIAAYQALEQLLADGKVRAIGVSNFMENHLDDLLAATTVVPAVNQLEIHPYFQQSALQRKNEALGILSQAWSPIGGVAVYGIGEISTPLEDPTIVEIAHANDRSAGQVVLRWHLQQGRSVIPKSSKPERIQANFDVFDFELTNDEIARINALEKGVRGGPESEDVNLDSAHSKEIPEA